MKSVGLRVGWRMPRGVDKTGLLGLSRCSQVQIIMVSGRCLK